jgi:hypothetical protein
MPGGRRGAANITGDKARRIAVNMAHGRMQRFVWRSISDVVPFLFQSSFNT